MMMKLIKRETCIIDLIWNKKNINIKIKILIFIENDFCIIILVQYFGKIIRIENIFFSNNHFSNPY